MNTIQTIDTKGHNQKLRPVRLYVVKSSKADDCLQVSVADSTGCIKALVYDEQKYSLFASGKSLLVQNYSLGRGSRMIMISKKTLVKPSASLKQNIDDSILSRAEMLVDPPARPPTRICEVTEDDIITVQGYIVQDTARSEDNNVKNVVLDDGSGKMQVALWNKMSLSPVKTGNHVTISHTRCKYNNFLKELALNTTAESSIQNTPVPLTSIRGTIIAADSDAACNTISLTVHGSDDVVHELEVSSEVLTRFDVSVITESDVLEKLGDQTFMFDVRGTVVEMITRDVEN